MADNVGDTGSIGLFLSEVRWRRDDQIQRLSVLEQKLVTAFTLNVAVMALFGAALGIAGGPFPLSVQCLVFSTVFLFVVGLAVATSAYLNRGWYGMIDLRYFSDLLGKYDTTTLTEWYMAQVVSGIEANEIELVRLSRLTARAIQLSASTAVMVGITAAVYVALRSAS